MKIECVLQCANHLGEGPVWDIEEGRLYWVDGTGRRAGKPSIWRLDARTGKTENWSIKRDVGALALRKKGGAVLALDDGFHFFDFQSGKLETVSLVDTEHSRTRLNDGKCDRRGRFFAGGMDDKEELKICALWRLDPDLSVTLVDDGIICSNGPCWSPDDKTFYFADTFQGEIWKYDYDVEIGTPANKRLFASVERRIGMPVRNITSVVFGGEKLDEIYVTSMARVKHPAVHERFAKEAKPQFLAGSLFRIIGLGIRGVPEPRFAG